MHKGHIALFAFTLGAVFLGIYIYHRLVNQQTSATNPTLTQPGSTGVISAISTFFTGVDPISGAGLAPGAKPGTVGFSAQGN